MSFLRHEEIYPFDEGVIPQDHALPHRTDEFPAGYSSAGCTPAVPASASPAGSHLARQRLRCTIEFQRTAGSVLTVCLSPGDHPNDAIRIYQQAINLNRQQAHLSPWPPLNLGALLVKLGRLQEAQASFRESLRSDSQFPKAHYQMGLLLEKEKKSDEAIHELNLAARFDPTDPEPHYALAGLYQRLGVKERAEAEWKTFEKLKKDTPREPPFWKRCK